MNRIILIGNGFDLAHGLKTSYKDFINWYWREWGECLRQSQNSVEEDRLCLFGLREKYTNWYRALHSDYQIITQLNPRDGLEIFEIVKQNSKLFAFRIKSPLFNELYKSFETKKWVDIENEYYAYISHDGITHDDVKEANDDMDFIKSKLIEYLKFVQEEASKSPVVDVDNGLKNKFLEDVKESDVSCKWKLERVSVPYSSLMVPKFEDIKQPDKIMLLNFNYTDIADGYLPLSKFYTIVHIHGELSNPSSVIFGYGDELDDDYRLLLKKNDNEYLRNIKSIRYMGSSCYRAVLEFIESAPFQIYIMGHSCGNSDRTLLNTLFEHKNCVSIKPYYYVNENGEDNYLELVQNISRNFTDMKLMRDRVVNKKFCETLQ